MVPAELIDRSNYRRWKVPFAERPVPLGKRSCDGAIVRFRDAVRCPRFRCVALALGVPALAQPRPAPAAQPAAALIDLNSASRDDLMTLDGIGEVRANAIIRARPFRAKTELVERRLIPESLYEKISETVMARAPANAPPPAAKPAPGTPPKRS